MELRKRTRDLSGQDNKISKKKRELTSKQSKLIDELFINIKSSNDINAILIIGSPGSGKSNYISSNNDIYLNYIKISRDYFVEKMNINQDNKWKILQFLISHVENRAIKECNNILWEITGRNWSDISRIRKICKINNFSLKIIFITSEIESCKKRIIHREKILDRKVVINDFNLVNKQIQKNYNRIDLQSNESKEKYVNIWIPK
jgi:predicted kinase